MKVDYIQTSFVGGEFAPSLYGRTDIAQYSNACKIVENMLPRPYGPVISAPGTEYINACKTGGSTSIVRLLEFVFSRTDSYVIEVGVGYFRFYTDGGVVVSAGTTPYEVAHTYTATEIDELQYSQLNDVIYITHPDHPPRRLTRFSSNSWTLTDFPFTGGPFLSDNVIYSGGTTTVLSSATITPSGTAGSITLSCTSNVFIPSASTTGHVGTFWKVGALVTNSTTGLQEQGYVQISAVTNPSTATATVISKLSGTSATSLWAQGAWSSVLGYPARVSFHQQRLFFARTDFQPQNIWGSRVFTYENFALNAAEDDDALNIQLASTESNDIKWLASGDKLIAGTYGGDFVIGSGDDSPMTPSNVNVFKQTGTGSEPIQPKKIGNLFYYVQRFGTKMRELLYFWDNDSYRSIDKTILSPHISGVGGFKAMAYQQNPDTILWAVCSNGTLATLTREIDQEVQGWARHTTDGEYESVAVIPSQSEDYDEVWVVVKRTINGSDVRYIERFKSISIPDNQSQCFYVHSGLSYSAFDATVSPTSTAMSFSYPGSTTKLLLHFNGENGSVAVTDSAAAKTITVLGQAQISTEKKVFGTGSLRLPNILGNDANTLLLLKLENNVTDSSASARTVTNSSVTFSSSDKVFGGYSGIFDGVSSYLSVGDSADWAFGTGDFTIDLRAKFNSISSDAALVTQFADASNYWRFFWNLTQLVFQFEGGGNIITCRGSWVPTVGIWYLLSIVRSGNIFTLYVDGTAVGTETATGSITDIVSNLNIGRQGSGTPTNYFNGKLDEIRISNVARWTSNFVIPGYEYGSTGDYLSTADSDDYSFAAGNFALNQRVNFDDITTEQVFLGQYADANNYWFLKKQSAANGNKLQLKFRSSGTDIADYVMSSTWGSLAINTWYDITAIRSSSTVLICIDGTSQTLTGTVTIGTSNVGNVSAALLIGQQNSTGYLKGYLDELRIVKGDSTQSGSFTIPTSEYDQAGTVALVTTSAAYFSSGNVGKRLRAIDSSGEIVGEMNITGYTSSTIVVGSITTDFSAFNYAAGLWGISVSSISGLDHLEAKTVNVLTDGVIHDTRTVSGGSITLNSDYFYVISGLPYTQKIKTLPPEIGSQRGTAQGKLQRINQLSLKVNRSYQGIEVGRDEDNIDTVRVTSPSLYSGTLANIFFKGDYKYGAEIYIQNTKPLPLELLSIIQTIDTQDK